MDTFYPAPEDLLLAVVKPLELVVPNLKVRTLIEDDMFTCPYILVHAGTGAYLSDAFATNLGGGDGDIRFLRRFLADVQVWVEGENAEQRAWALHELVRVTVFRAFQNQTVFPGIGSIARFKVSSPGHKTPDWATATGVNQYANLPKSMVRYQAMYSMSMRPDFQNPISESDLVTLISS